MPQVYGTDSQTLAWLFNDVKCLLHSSSLVVKHFSITVLRIPSNQFYHSLVCAITLLNNFFYNCHSNALVLQNSPGVMQFTSTHVGYWYIYLNHTRELHDRTLRDYPLRSVAEYFVYKTVSLSSAIPTDLGYYLFVRKIAVRLTNRASGSTTGCPVNQRGSGCASGRNIYIAFRLCQLDLKLFGST